MPNRLSDEKACLIATNYCTNGNKKTKALLRAGYKRSYAEHGGLKLFDNIKVKEAIARIQAGQQIAIDLTTAEVMADLKYGLERAKEKDDLQSIARFAELRGKTLGMFKDKILQEDITEGPTPEEADRISLERRENIRLKNQNKGDQNAG